MKTKKSIWSVALSLIVAFAMVFGITLVNQPKSVKADVTYDGHITFDVKVDDTENSISVPAGYSSAITVTYTVTETTGVDALQLRLGYDHTAFTLSSVSTIDDDQESTSFALGHATHGAEGYLENIVFDNVNSNGTAYVLDEEDEDDLIITAVFYLNQPTPATAYTFSLYNVNGATDATIGYSKAWKIAPNTEEGHEQDPAIHNPVEILFANEAIVYVRGSYTDFTLTGGSKTYDGIAVPNSAITITHGNTPVEMRPAISAENVVWFTYNEALWQEQNVSRYIKLDSNPVNAGTYYAVVEFNGNNFYNSYKGYTADELYGDYSFDIGEGKVAEYVILPKSVNVTIDNKSSAYGEALVALTHNGAEYLGINLSTTADNTVPGTYPITGTASNANYTVNFTNGTYTVTKKSVTVTIDDKSSVYGAELAELTHNGAQALGVTLSTTATSSSNVGTYPITGDWTNKTNYDVTFVDGTYTITSVGKTADYVKSFFSGATLTYDAEEHNLLIVDGEKPNWISYTASNNYQTHANTYLIAVTATVSEQDAKNYIDATLVGNQQYVTAVYGTINPRAVTVIADDKGHVYGNTPATLTPVTVGVNDEVNVNFVVKNGNETITLSTSTPVGTYTIVPSATNTNYAFTFNNGTYTVSKEDATISISAENIIYNRALDYTVSNAKVGTLDAPYTVEIRNSNNQVVTGVLPVGDYTIIATVAGTDNYNGATAQDTFSVSPNIVGKPIVDLELEIEQLHFNNDTVTWDAVTKDTFGYDLYNTTVTYRIGGVEYNNRSFTATSAGSYVLEILSSNENYLSNQVTLTVYSVTFTEGSHPASSTAEVEGLPATQYRFEGETATQPNAIPTVTGYTFNGWDFDFETEIEQNTEIPALWTINQVTIKVIVMHSGLEYPGTFTADYNSVIDTTIVLDDPESLTERAGIVGMLDEVYNKNGMHYVFANSWNYKVTGSEAEYVAAPASVNATQNYTFVAVYNATPIVYDITYYYSFDGANYTPYTIESAAYGSTINYLHVASRKWFRAEAWYLNAARTQVAPETMPAHDIEVYGALVFNVGKGDVNGDGNVDANDITLYRRWIVGGYEITALLNNEDLYEASELETEDPTDTVYFIARVADTNAATFDAETLGDGSKDIRDVSTIRMGLVGGYGFSIVEGVDVTGEDLIIVREFEVESANDLLALARSGAKVTLSEDITDATLDAEILDSNKDIIIDLNGHTLTLKSFRVTLAQGNTGKILVTNGRINVADGNGVYLTAVDGSVHLDDVTLYDDNGLFVIQTANHSLHLFNEVKFLKKDVNAVNNEAPAEVLIVKDSHVVVEENATLTIEKVVVAEIVVDEQTQEEQVVAAEETSAAEITITINDNVVINDNAEEEIIIEGNFSYEISNINELIAATSKGGDYKLVANITYNETAAFVEDAKINLNGYTLRSTNNCALAVMEGATLTIEGNGNVEAQEACVLVLDGSNVVINGGTYTSHDNFVVGTNGSTNRGNNTITINAGTFNGNIQSAGYVACGIYVANNDTVVVNDGTFNITNGVGILARSGNTTVGEDVVFNVTGNGTLGKVGDSKVTVPAGEVLVIDYAANYPGGTPVLTNNNTAEVYALVDDVASLNAAINVADKIIIADNIACESDYVVTKTTAINLNGKTITFAGWGFEVRNNATLTFNGNGNVTAVEAPLYAQKGGHLVVNGGTYTATANFVIGTHGSEGRGSNTVTINGGVFNGSMTVAGQLGGYIACGIYVANSDTVVVNGGTFNITNGVGILARSGNTTVGEDVVFNVTGNGTLGKVGDSNVTVPAGEVLVIDYAANYPGGTPVLTNNNTAEVYALVDDVASLNTANVFANTIALGADITTSNDIEFRREVTFDLNGHNVVFTNGAGFSVYANGVLTMKGNGNVSTREVCLYATNGGEIVVNGGTYTSTDNFVIGTNGSANRAPSKITVNAGIFNGQITTEGYIACGIYVANNDTVVVNGGTFNITNGVGILARSGNTTVGENVVFNVTGNGTNGKVGDSRVVIPSGAVLVIDYAANYPGGTPTLTNNTSYNATQIISGTGEGAQGNSGLDD